MERRRRRKCRHCGQLYQPDPRNRWHQIYCSVPACQAASKQASQRRWARSDLGRSYARRPEHARRVKAWRAAHPGYSKRRPTKSVALQDVLIPQPDDPQRDNPVLKGTPLHIPAPSSNDLSSTAADSGPLNTSALQDVLFLQSPFLIGLIAHLTGGALREDIASFARRVILLGRQIQGQNGPPRSPAHAAEEANPLPDTAAQSAAAVQLDRSSPGSG